MNCFVLRSEKKRGAYLYLKDQDGYAEIPDELQSLLGQCVQVMQLDLSQHKKLASEDIQTVKQNLGDQGYHLQMPSEVTTGLVNYGA